MKSTLFPRRSLIIFFLIFLLFCIKAYLYIDPDFGWRLKAGEYYLKNGIPKTDIFTYTMPTFPWVDHAWSQSLLFFLIDRYVGYFGLAFVYSVLVVTAILVSVLPVKQYILDNEFYRSIRVKSLEISFKNLAIFASFPVLLSTSILFTFFGVRAQVTSWLFLSILLFVLFDEERLRRLRLLLPIYFLLWANLHGSFLFGLVTVLIVFVLKSVRTKRFYLLDYLVVVLSSGMTLINPYGAGVWREVLSSASDTNLRWQIAEWMPALAMFDLAMVFLIATSLGLIWRYKSRFLLEEIGLFFVFLLQAVSSRRHLPLWVILATPLTIRALFYLWQGAKRIVKGEVRFKKIYQIAWILSLVVLTVQTFLAFREAAFLGRGSFYPVEAVSYLQRNIPSGEIFSEYGWGGYLIWKLPEKKVFIDGRMPSWERGVQIESELSDAFETYNQILKGKIDYGVLFDKFDVDTVLWTKPQKEMPLDKAYDKIAEYLTILGIEKVDFNLLERLEKDGWQKVYEDEVAVIYKLPGIKSQ